MDLEFCSWKDVIEKNRKRLPCGRIYSDDGLIKLSIHLFPNTEYVLFEEKTPENSLRLFSIQCIYPTVRDGVDDYDLRKVGIVRTTKQKGTFINFNFLPESYKLIDPNYEFVEADC